ncbi:hypothetical protein ACLB2K_046277 [Fragaria x ananassa]
MCPNPERHRTFNCPNLTPELKERLKELRSEFGHSKAFDPDDLCCHICEKKKDHWSSECPYLFAYQAGMVRAHVGPFAEFICMCCGEMDAHPASDFESSSSISHSLSVKGNQLLTGLGHSFSFSFYLFCFDEANLKVLLQ